MNNNPLCDYLITTGRIATTWVLVTLIGSLVVLPFLPGVHTLDGQSQSHHHQHVFGGQDEEEPMQLTGADICALTGYFVIPHPCNCQMFYTWYQGLFVENACEPGLFFDCLSLTCTLPEHVTCADGFGPPPPLMDEGGQSHGEREEQGTQ